MTSADLDRLSLLAAPGGWFQLASVLPVGVLVSHGADAGRLGIALLLPAELAGLRCTPAFPGRPRVVRGFGAGGTQLASPPGWSGPIAWTGLGRPGSRELGLTVRARGCRSGAARSGLRPAAAAERGNRGGLAWLADPVTERVSAGSLADLAEQRGRAHEQPIRVAD